MLSGTPLLHVTLGIYGEVAAKSFFKDIVRLASFATVASFDKVDTLCRLVSNATVARFLQAYNTCHQNMLAYVTGGRKRPQFKVRGACT